MITSMPTGARKPLPSDRRAWQRPPKGRCLVILPFCITGILAGAATAAALGYWKGGVDCDLLDSPEKVDAGSHATVRFLLSNRIGRKVSLRPRSVPCWRARLEGMPTELQPYECREIGLILNTTGLNGPNRFVAAISTDASPRVVMMKADVSIYADRIIRGFMLGRLPANIPVVKRIRVDNVPAEHLVRVGSPSKPCWSVRVISAIDRVIEIELAATLPPLDPGVSVSEIRNDCDFSLFFTDADVRKVQITATGFVAAEADHAD